MVRIEHITPVGRLLARLTPMDTEARVDAIMEEISATGVNNLMRYPQGHNGPFACIQLHEIAVTAPDVTTACNQWIALALDALPTLEAVAEAWACMNDADAHPDEAMLAHTCIQRHVTDPQELARANDLLRRRIMHPVTF